MKYRPLSYEKVLGMNTQALNQLYHQAIAMMDQALSTIHELKTLEETNDNGELSEEEKKKRRRLKAIRWSIVFGISYAGYSLFRKWLRKRRYYKEYMSRTGGRMITGQDHSHHHSHNHNQYSSYSGGGRGLYSNSNVPHGGMDDYYSRSPRYNHHGYYGNTYDHQGYQPSYYPGQSYNSHW